MTCCFVRPLTVGGAFALVADLAFAGPTLTKVVDFPTASCSIHGSTLYGEIGNKVYFLRGEDIWQSDGTATGTQVLVHAHIANPNVPGWYYYPAENLGAVGSQGIIVFGRAFSDDPGPGVPPSSTWLVDVATATIDRTWSARLDATFTLGSKRFIVGDDQLAETDGTRAGTKLITKFVLGADADVANPSHGVVYADGAMAIIGRFGKKNIDYFSTDGTAAGTRRLTNTSFYASSNPGFSAGQRIGNFLYIPDTATHKKLVKVDLTASTWAETTVFEPTKSSTVYSPSPVVGGRFTFSADQVYVSDGTAAGTVPFGVSAFGGVRFGSSLALTSSHAGTNELVLTDLTSPGTTILMSGKSTVWDGGVADAFANATRATLVDGLVYADLDDGVHGFELWSSDGTLSGTKMVTDLTSGPGSTAVEWIGPSTKGGAYVSLRTAATACALYKLTNPTSPSSDGGVSDASASGDASTVDAATTDASVDASLVSPLDAGRVDAATAPPEPDGSPEQADAGCSTSRSVNTFGQLAAASGCALILSRVLRRRTSKKSTG